MSVLSVGALGASLGTASYTIDARTDAVSRVNLIAKIEQARACSGRTLFDSRKYWICHILFFVVDSLASRKRLASIGWCWLCCIELNGPQRADGTFSKERQRQELTVVTTDVEKNTEHDTQKKPRRKSKREKMKREDFILQHHFWFASCPPLLR